MYNTYYGVIVANVTLSTAQNETVYAYNEFENASGNLFFVRSGSNIEFTALKALGKTTTGLNTSNDFSDADALLNMTGFNDCVNARWADNTDRPSAFTTITIYGTNVTGIPIIDSDSSGNFVTGILWDSSKDASDNTEYDQTDKEPLVFITMINQDAPSDYGIQDYVAEVPALLRSYAGSEDSTITVYYEIQ